MSVLARGQILYRIAEMCEARRVELETELVRLGETHEAAQSEVDAAIDCWVYYAGWSDKFGQLLGSVNAVNGPYFNFTVPEPTGVVGLLAPDRLPLASLVERLAPIIVSGNSVVAVPSQHRPLAAIALSEALATSDVPVGVVNIVTGFHHELAPVLAGHLDVNAIDIGGIVDVALAAQLGELASVNVKRLVGGSSHARTAGRWSLGAILEFLEMKTIWHPTGF
jgi:acyl-CoA reductase-like NAD-dependent aldehyde dehydrogenase